MDNYNNFARRHIGLNQSNVDDLLAELGYKNLEDFSKAVLPENIFIG
jgi:glycine cleavage system pyridoxal-binding protein P